jgi:hypothetical protein
MKAVLPSARPADRDVADDLDCGKREDHLPDAERLRIGTSAFLPLIRYRCSAAYVPMAVLLSGNRRHSAREGYATLFDNETKKLKSRICNGASMRRYSHGLHRLSELTSKMFL